MKKENPKLAAEIRTLKGKKVKRLRAEGLLPATLYGKGVDSISLQMERSAVERVWENVGESGLVDLMVEKEEALPILLRNPQYGVVSDILIHVDCYKVNLKEKIVASVPIELIGESFSVKNGNILVEVTSEVEVEALPADLPEKLEVDLSALKTVEDTITVADLKVDKEKVEIKTAEDQLIVKTEEPKEEEVIEETVAPEEVEATKQKGEGEEGEEEEKKEEEKTNDRAENKTA
ncbi:50S ribosomal protein L25 [Patescibacteria group bacterium]|nr:50S ribosomal protein L25 [Patescibacteria group bacterium]